MPTTLRERVRETTVYLPLGAYDKAVEQITGLRNTKFSKVYDRLVDRGEERVQEFETLARKALRRADRAEDKARAKVKKTAKKTVSRATAATSAVAPKIPAVAAPRRASDLAIPAYASKTASEIAAETKGLTQTQLAQIYKFEKAHEDRATILEAIESKLVDLPIKTYDDMSVEEIHGRIKRLTEKSLKTLRRYELDTKNRSTVIDRIDQLLA